MDQESRDSNAFLKQLRRFPALPSEDMAKECVSFFEQLDRQSDDIQSASFKLLIEEESSLVLEYNAVRALLARILLRPNLVDDVTLRYLVNIAKDHALILTKKYEFYINEHPGFLGKKALKKQLNSYSAWLTLSALVVMQEPKKSWLDNFVEQLRAEFTTDRMNPRRLYFLRERRLLLLLVPIIKDFAHYSSWILWADAYVAPFLVYLNLLFFVPRLVFNLYTLCDNVFNESNMTPESKRLGVQARFMAQWSRLWPQLMNDLGWATSGVLMCFVFVGSWLPFGIYFSVAMQCYDVVMATIRLCMDLNRLNHLTAQYQSLVSDENKQHSALPALYFLHLNEAIRREKKLLYLAFSNAVVLFIAVCLTIPIMAAISPWLPVVGAIVAILMTIVNFQLRSYFNDYLNPPDSPSLESLLEKDLISRQSSQSAIVPPFSLKQDQPCHDNMTFFSSEPAYKLPSSPSPSPVGVNMTHSMSLESCQ